MHCRDQLWIRQSEAMYILHSEFGRYNINRRGVDAIIEVRYLISISSFTQIIWNAIFIIMNTACYILAFM